jgi:hypothetical protein
MSLNLLGVALALVPLGLPAIGVELSPFQGYVLLVLAGICVIGGIAVLFLPQKPQDHESLGASVQMFNVYLRQKFLNLYMDKSERLQKENEQLRAQREAPQEKASQPENDTPTNPQ